MPKTIDDLRALGYEVGFAHGSVAIEEGALASAKDAAAPGVIANDVRTVTAEVAALAAVEAAEAVRLGQMTHEEALAYAKEQSDLATERAFEMLTTIRTEAVAFHERALASAKAQPDVFFVSALGDPGTPDDDIRIYVACKADGMGWDETQQEILDSLCDPEVVATAMWG